MENNLKLFNIYQSAACKHLKPQYWQIPSNIIVKFSKKYQITVTLLLA
jgi:hypothetical protein